MDPYEVHKRVGEVLHEDAARGRLGDLAAYQARFPGHEDVVEAEYRALRQADGGALAGLDVEDLASHHQHRYVTRGEIARGSMGAIYHVRDEVLDRDLAMKFMLRSEPGSASGPQRDDESLARRFVNEAKITARLDHPGVVPVHELGRDGEGRVFFTMKKVQGMTLQQVFEAAWTGDPAWPRNRVLRVFVRVLETLAYAHEKGIVHRDLKPANVMVGDFGEVYVMDWGLAKTIHTDAPEAPQAAKPVERKALPRDTRSTAIGQVLGTPAYMAPEQARSESLDRRADLYAVGAMLYEFVCGRHPYSVEGSSTLPHKLVLDLIRGPPPLLEEMAPHTQPELAAIINKAMARKPADRYDSALQFASDVTSFVEGRVVGAHRTGSWVEFRKWVGRNRALAGALGAALLFLVAGFVTATALGLRAKGMSQRAQEQSQLSRRQAYLANIAAAVAELDQREVQAVRLRLERAPEDLRGWEWAYLTSHLDESILTIEGIAHAFEPDTARLLVLDASGVVRAWDLDQTGGSVVVERGAASDTAWLSEDGRYRATVEPMPGAVGAWKLVVNPLGRIGAPRTIEFEAPTFAFYNWAGALGNHAWCRHMQYPWFAYGDPSEALTFHNVVTGEIRKPALPRPSGICGARPEEGLVLIDAVDAGEIRVFDLASFETRLSIPCPRPSRVVAACWTPDGRHIVTSGADRIVRLFDAQTGEAADWREVGGHSELVGALAVSPDGGLLATGGNDHLILLRDMHTGDLRAIYHGHEDGICHLDFSPDGQYLVSTSTDGEVRVWTAGGGDPSVLRGHAAYVYAVAFSPDGKRIYSGGWDGYAGAAGALRIWDVATGALIASLGPADRCVFSLAVTRDGRYVVTTGGDRSQRWAGGPISVWDTSTGRVVREFPGEYRSVALCSNDRHVLCSERGGGVEILDLATGESVGQLDETSPEGFESAPACSPDGRWIVRKDKGETTFSLWRRADGTKHLTFRGHEDLIWDLAFCPDSMRIISASADHTARVWDVETGEQLAILAGHGAGVLTAKFGPRGRYILTGGRDANLRLWDASSYEQVIRLSGHESYVIDAAISPDGETIATASGDHTVRLWGTKPLKDQHQRWLARRAVVDTVSGKVEALFDALGDPDAVVTALREDATLDDDEREVALQLALIRAVADAAR